MGNLNIFWISGYIDKTLLLHCWIYMWKPLDSLHYYIVKITWIENSNQNQTATKSSNKMKFSVFYWNLTNRVTETLKPPQDKHSFYIFSYWQNLFLCTKIYRKMRKITCTLLFCNKLYFLVLSVNNTNIFTIFKYSLAYDFEKYFSHESHRTGQFQIFYWFATKAAEIWMIKKADRKRINAFEIWIHRRILQISWTAHSINKFVK